MALRTLTHHPAGFFGGLELTIEVLKDSGRRAVRPEPGHGLDTPNRVNLLTGQWATAAARKVSLSLLLEVSSIDR